MMKRVPVLVAAGVLSACNVNGSSAAPTPASAAQVQAEAPAKNFTTTEVTRFDSPWAMTFLPDGRLLVTEMAGTLRLYDPASGNVGEITGVPRVEHVGQGGLGDVVLHPDFPSNQLVYISFNEADGRVMGAAIARARLDLDDAGGGALRDLEVIWRQDPKTRGDGHFGHRMAFGPDGKLFVSSSDRKEMEPAQDMAGNLGKIVRLEDDGAPADGNPFAGTGGVAAQTWTLGHRNILGLAFDDAGQLWAHEMGPRGGDELNRIERGANYGYPIVSEGNHYSGARIPDHDTRPDFQPPVLSWNPVISPSGFVIYDGELFPGWQGDGFIGGLSSRSLVRIEFDGDSAREAGRYDMGRRIREVEQGPDGAIWLLEDGGRRGSGSLLRLSPEA